MAKLPKLPPEPPEINDLDEARRVIGELWVLTHELLARVEQSSQNSSKPPSSDGAGAGGRRAQTPSGRSRGGQKGHKGHRRERHEAVDQVVEHRPQGRCECGGLWQCADQPYYRHQVFELPPLALQVTEHRLFTGRCCRCSATTRARLPEGVAPGQMGPRLLSWLSLWSGGYHLSVRQIQRLLHEQFGATFSVGAISQAQGQVSPMLTPLHQGLKQAVRGADQVHVDETGHQRGREKRWLWVAASAQAVCLMTHYSRARFAAQKLIGADPPGVVISDGLAVYRWLAPDRHQLCWAHVLRQVTALAERPGPTGVIGRRLRTLAQAVFRTRHRVEQQTLSEVQYRHRMQRLRMRFRAALETGTQLAWTRYAGRCQYLLRDEARLWTFLQNRTIPLTNNEAERRIRGYVLWRKGSFGVWSHRGELFRHRILSLVETCRVRGLSAFSVLERIVSAVIERRSYPDDLNLGRSALSIPSR